VNILRRQFLRTTGAIATLWTSPRFAWAQAYPARPVRMIVPFGPGGNADILGRIIAQKLSERFGEQFYVENVGGAGGNIGVGRAAQGAPDGVRSKFSNRASSRACPMLPLANKWERRSMM
jgi:tripartite-type tricarboxylate transporter receptor subunit TctC